MSRIHLLFIALGWGIAACGGAETQGLQGNGGRSSFTGSGGTDSTGGSAGSFDPSGTGGDSLGTGGDPLGTGGADVVEPDAQAEAGDASTNGVRDAASDVTGNASSDARTSDASDARAADATVDVNARDASATAQCTAMPQQDDQCRTRPPHRYVCPQSVGTPSGCERT
ncbi:MAG TPA: hypothetical protein VGL13_05070, partial [Polyangiaceae bacterium]